VLIILVTDFDWKTDIDHFNVGFLQKNWQWLLTIQHLLYIFSSVIFKIWDFNQYWIFSKSSTEYSNQQEFKHDASKDSKLLSYSSSILCFIWRSRSNEPSNIQSSHFLLLVILLFVFKTHIKNKEIRNREEWRWDWKTKLKSENLIFKRS
jgi:hypothetical protein